MHGRFMAFVGLGVVLVAVVAGIALQAAFDAQKQSEPPSLERPMAGALVALPLAAVGGEYPLAAIREVEAAAYAAAINEAIYAQMVVEELERQAAARAASARAQRGGGVRCDGVVWDCLAECESSGDWNIDTGNGFYGGLQIADPGARGMTREEQIAWAEQILARQGWGAWPACSSKLGLR